MQRRLPLRSDPHRISLPVRLRRFALCVGLATPLLSSIAGCDETRHGEPNATAPTAIAWLAPVGSHAASGRAIFVGREKLDLTDPSETHFMLRIRGLEPGPHFVRLRRAADCEDLDAVAADLKQIRVEVGAGPTFEYEQDLESFGFSSDGAFAIRSVVIDVAHETAKQADLAPARRALACGVVDYLGALRHEEGKPQQSP